MTSSAPAKAIPPIVVIVGPTASGKSALAVELALQLGNAEIVNADSMLVYRGMDIGTAKPSVAERRGVPHHLIDIMDVRQVANVADFQQLARETIAQLRARQITPIVVGGSSLYVRAIVDEFEFPGQDPTIRAHWESELERVGSEALHAELARRSPQAAANILPGNGRRIVRALEIHDLTGNVTGQLPEPKYALNGVHQFGLQLERDELDERIERRVHEMFAAGLVDEVADLLEIGLREGQTASRALGYRQVIEMLDGDLTLEQAIQAVIDQTRRFARKQLMWYRKDPRIHWLPAGSPANVTAMIDALPTQPSAAEIYEFSSDQMSTVINQPSNVRPAHPGAAQQ